MFTVKLLLWRSLPVRL